MIISELILQLESLKQEHGDLPVKTYKNHPTDGLYDGGYDVVSARLEKCSGGLVSSYIDLVTREFKSLQEKGEK